MEEIVIECDNNGIVVNGNKFSFPLSMEKLIKVFGKPSLVEYEDIFWHVAWDNLGIFTSYCTSDIVLDMRLLFKRQPEIKYLPQNIFNGSVLVEGKNINEVEINTIRMDNNVVTILEWCCIIEKNYDISEEQKKKAKNKYALQGRLKNVLHFEDFNFKLLVINELMYRKNLLKPKFDVYEFTELYEKRKIDIEEEGYGLIPEVVEYFGKIEIDQKFAAAITELDQDGGNEIYGQLCPFWDGEDDLFDIKTYKDIEHFSSLKEMTLMCDDQKIFEELRSKGIDVQPL